LAAAALENVAHVVAVATEIEARLGQLRTPGLRVSVDDANAHLGRLVRPGFVLSSGIARLGDIERYVRALLHRLEHLRGAGERDRRRMAEVVPLEQRFAAHLDGLGSAPPAATLLEVRWQLEELRVSVFAQSLGARGQISTKRIRSVLAAAGG
jgi:ATP-dependent helicase HrpA